MYESEDKMVSHPNHYQSTYGFEVIDVIEDYTRELYGIFATDTANMIKYICRWKQKNGIQDLEKAIWYATHLKDRCNNFRYLEEKYCCDRNIMLIDVVDAFTEGLDAEETDMTLRSIVLACDWYTYINVEEALQRFINNVHSLIKYEKEKENK